MVEIRPVIIEKEKQPSIQTLYLIPMTQIISVVHVKGNTQIATIIIAIFTQFTQMYSVLIGNQLILLELKWMLVIPTIKGALSVKEVMIPNIFI